MTAQRKYFGTDGIRGTVGVPPVTPDFIMKLGWAAGRVLAKQGSGGVLIGKDTRISGYMFESALEAGLSAAGVDTLLLGPMPTPAIAYLTRTFRAHAGIVISASHNPYNDNGIKFFSDDGRKLSDEVELAIEAELEKPMKTVGSSELGRAQRVSDASGRYIEFCKNTIPTGANFDGLSIVVDSAHGAAYHVAPLIFEELGGHVISMGDQPDGLNINEACGATDPAELQRRVLEYEADVGVALDGDADRLIMVDHRGEIVDGDELLYIIAREKQRNQGLKGAVVGTLMSNLGLEHAIRDLGLDFERTKVGDRYILEVLTERGWTLGGETSGHIICLDLNTTGDGIVAALQVLYAMGSSNNSLHALKQGMHKYPQELINVRVEGGADVIDREPVREHVKAVEAELADSGRVLLRPSGTEPLVRVMVEGRDAAQVERLARQLAETVEQALD
jgi:phosphoglucosamine mutase